MADDRMRIEIVGDFKKIERDLINFQKKLKSTKFEMGKSSGITNLNRSFRTLNSSVKSTNQNIVKMGSVANSSISRIKTGSDKATKSVDALGDSGLSAVSKFAKWYAISGVVTGLTNAIKGMFDVVADLDDSITLMNFTFDATEKQFEGMIDASSEFAKQLGSNTQEVLEAVKIYTNLNDTQEEILKKSTASVVLSNLGGTAINIERAAESIQAIQAQFGLFEDEAMDVVDTLTYVSANLSMDFTKGINEISRAVKASGALVSEAGFTYEEFIAIVGKLAEKTRLSGSTISAGIKTIFSRIQRVNELSADEISKIEGAYRGVGIEVRKSETEFQDMSVTVDQLSKRWSTLTSVEKSYIAELSAGVRQKSIFINLMDTYSESVGLATEATNANGFAMERNQIFVESLGGRINAFKEQYQELARSVVQRDFMKDFVNTGTSFLKLLTDINGSFGLLNVTIFATIGYIGILKSNLIVLKATGIITWVGELIAMVQKLGVAMTITAGFGGVLEAQLAGLTLGIGLIIGAFVAYDIHQKKIQKNIKDLSTTMTDFKSSNDSVMDMIDRLEDLSKKMAMTKKEADEFSQIQEKLNTLYPQATDAINKQNDSLSEQVEIYRKLAEARRDEEILQAQETLVTGEDQYERARERVERLQGQLEGYEKTVERLIKQKVEENNLSATEERILKRSMASRDSLRQRMEKDRETIKNYEDAQRKLNIVLANVDPIFERIDAYNKEIDILNKSNDDSNKATRDRIQNEIELTRTTIEEVSKRIAEYKKEAMALEVSKSGMVFTDEDFKTAPLSNMFANILESQKAELEKTLTDLNKQFEEIENTETKHLKTTKKKTKETAKYLAELQKIKDIQHEINMLQGKASLLTEAERISQLQLQIDKLEDLKKAQHELNEARRADLKNLKKGSEEYNKLKNEINSTSEAWWKAENDIKNLNDSVDKFLENLNENIDKTNESIAKIVEKKRIQDFNRELSNVADAFKPATEMVSQLSKQIDMLGSDKISLLNKSIERLSANDKKVGELSTEFDDLSNMIAKAQTSAEKEKLAKQMKSVSDNLRDAQLNAVNFATEIGKVKIEALEEGHENVTEQIKEQIDLLDSQLKPLLEGFLSDFDDMPVVNDLAGERPDFTDYQQNISNIFNNEKERIAQINQLRQEANEDDIDETNKAYQEEITELIKHKAELNKKLELAYGVEKTVAENHYRSMLNIIQSFAGSSIQAVSSLTRYANELVASTKRIGTGSTRRTSYTTGGAGLLDVDFSKNTVGYDGKGNFIVTPNYENGGVAGGLSIVGDGHGSNGAEMLVYPNGRAELSDNQAQLKMLPQGTQVIPANLTKELMANKSFNKNIMPHYANGKWNSPQSFIKFMKKELRYDQRDFVPDDEMFAFVSKYFKGYKGRDDGSFSFTRLEKQFDKLKRNVTPEQMFKELDLPDAPSLSMDTEDLLNRQVELKEKLDDIREKDISDEKKLTRIQRESYQFALENYTLQLDARKDLIENQDEYIKQLRSEYEENKKNPELATILLEKYNQAIQQRNSYVEDLRNNTKAYYELIIKGEQDNIDDQKRAVDILEKKIKLSEEQGKDSSKLYEELKKEVGLYAFDIRASMKDLKNQRDELEIGSYEWNILNDQVEKYEESLIDAQTDIAKLNNELEEARKKEVFDELDKQLSVFEEMKNQEISRLEAQRTRRQEQDKELEMTRNIQQAQDKLNDTMKQRNVRLFTGKGFELVADPKAVASAREDLTTAQKTMEEYKYNQAIDAQIQSIRNEIVVEQNRVRILKDMYSQQKINNDELVENANIIINSLRPANDQLIESYEAMGNVLDANIEKYNSLAASISYALDKQAELNLMRENPVTPSGGKGASSNVDQSRNFSVSNVNVKTSNVDGLMRQLDNYTRVS